MAINRKGKLERDNYTNRILTPPSKLLDTESFVDGRKKKRNKRTESLSYKYGDIVLVLKRQGESEKTIIRVLVGKGLTKVEAKGVFDHYQPKR